MTKEQEEKARQLDKDNGFKYSDVDFVSTNLDPVFTQEYNVLQNGVKVGRVYRDARAGEWTTNIDMGTSNHDQYRNDLFERISYHIHSLEWFKAHKA